jgi:hypothetical protein
VPAPNAKDIIASALNPLGLAVAAVGGATYALSGLWWLLPTTAVAMGAVAAAQYRANRASTNQLEPQYAERERILLGLMARIDRALADAGPTIRSALPDVPQQLAQMRGKVAVLLRQQSRIDEFLLDGSQQSGDEELTRLQAALSAARTDHAREKFQSAITSKQSELAAREELQASSERITAELAELQATLANSLSRIMSFEHGAGLQTDGQSIGAQLGDVLLTIEALEQALSDVHDPDGRRRRRA